jgi:SRSO17 transposase
MTEKQLSEASRRRERFLHDLVEPMGRNERRHWAQVYIQGLLLDGRRKSVQPMAERIAGADGQLPPPAWRTVTWRVSD